MSEPHSLTIEFDDPQSFREFLGGQNKNLRALEAATGAGLAARGEKLFITGEPGNVELAARAAEDLYRLLKSGYPLFAPDIAQAVKVLRANRRADLKAIFLDTLFVSSSNRVISPKGLVQKQYVDAIRKHDIVFAVGPAGTGKTYLAMAMAVQALTKKMIKRIVLTRPAVEAGERLGFLPGDLAEKVNPYLRPLYDALHDMMDYDKVRHLMDTGAIEVAPLAFMRGRTLNESFVILDEAQNTTAEQMKMFLTRLGYSSKAVITGDVTQVDLPRGKLSGLSEAVRILRDVDGIGQVFFSSQDVVRHPLVQRIIDAYEEDGLAEAALDAGPAPLSEDESSEDPPHPEDD